MSNILVAEDEPRISNFVERGLRSAGYACTVPADGAEALIDAQSGAFDLVLLDVGLPSLDGFGVLRRLRATHPSLPVIMLTARNSVEDTVLGLDSGASDYLAKPFKFDELLARIRLRLRDSEQTASGRRAERWPTATSASMREPVALTSLASRSTSPHGSSHWRKSSSSIPSRFSAESSCSVVSGGTIRSRVRTSSTSPSATCGTSWGMTSSRPSEGWDTGFGECLTTLVVPAVAAISVGRVITRIGLVFLRSVCVCLVCVCLVCGCRVCGCLVCGGFVFRYLFGSRSILLRRVALGCVTSAWIRPRADRAAGTAGVAGAATGGSCLTR